MDKAATPSKWPRLLLLSGLSVLTLCVLFFARWHRADQRLMNIVEGLSVCMQRVSQSYTAKLIGEVQSNYLSGGFMATTEECFGESISLLEMASAPVGEKALEKLNLLSNHIYQFHRQLETSSPRSSAPIEPLERARDGIVAALNQDRTHLKALAQRSYWAFLASALLLFACLGLSAPAKALGQWYQRRHLKLIARRACGPPSKRGKTRPSPAQTLEIEALLNSLIDCLSSKFFAAGIALKLESTPSKVHAFHQPLEQALYRLFNDFMDGDDTRPFCKSVIVRTEKTEKQTILDLTFMWATYTPPSSGEFALDHSLTAALIKHCGGELLLENLINAHTQTKNYDKSKITAHNLGQIGVIAKTGATEAYQEYAARSDGEAESHGVARKATSDDCPDGQCRSRMRRQDGLKCEQLCGVRARITLQNAINPPRRRFFPRRSRTPHSGPRP